MMDQTITLEQLASILKTLPIDLVNLRLDEIIAAHVANRLEGSGLVIDRKAWYEASLCETHFREVISQTYQDLYFKNKSFSPVREPKYECSKCRAKFVSNIALEVHQAKNECKHVIPQVKQGNHMLDLNKLA